VQFPAGQVDLTALCPPGSRHVLSLLLAAKPLEEVMLSFSDTNSARRTKSRVERRGLCGDVYLLSEPAGPLIGDVQVDTSVRKGQITVSTRLHGLGPNVSGTRRVPPANGTRSVPDTFKLHAVISEQGRKIKEFTGRAVRREDLEDGRLSLTEPWKPEKLWDIHTPENTYDLAVSLEDGGGDVLDAAYPVRFGFREFWIDGRDFYLNGNRIFLSALPVDNAQVSAAAASYEGAKETLLRLKAIGINFVYTHNYGCEPGTHLGFEEILRAADDVGMLVALSQPHFAQYGWNSPEADQRNGYAEHARFYTHVAGNHPSVVFYSMSHNATGYDEDMNPDLIDGLDRPHSPWADNNVKRALRAEAIVKGLDPRRIVYHHSSGNLSSMHTSNFYTNMAPIQELDDWFEHWATAGVKPMFTCEYMVPCTWDWTMYRGWYKGVRTWGSAAVPWEFCLAEWSSQFLGDRAYQITEAEKRNLRWEAQQFRAGRLWHRWDYPNQVGSRVFAQQHEIIGRYLADNWRAFRTWGVSAISPWEYHFFWRLRDGVDKSRQQLKVDWEKLQRPGFSADYLADQPDRMDISYERSDWVPTADGQAILANNGPLLAYIAGKPEAFTSKDHNFTPGETIHKQLVLINNSRETVTAACRWTLDLPQPINGTRAVKIATGQQERIPLDLPLPTTLAPGTYSVAATASFDGAQTQKDRFAIHVVPPTPPVKTSAKVALFDPKGETANLLAGMRVEAKPVEAGADLAGYDVLVIGKQALTVDGPGPDLGRVRDGLKVVVFEQTPETLERRLGFRIAEYGLRQVFRRVPDHPTLAGLNEENLRDWRGEATLQPTRLTYTHSPKVGGPIVKWCGLDLPHVWRRGNRGNVASVLIEKPARGDFLPILDGGFSLQYSPLLEYREGKGLVLFCQCDVSGRTEQDPAAEILAHNIMEYVAAWKPAPRRQAVYAGGPAGKRYLDFAGISPRRYESGKLSPEEVLIVSPGGGEKLAADAAAVAEFLKAGHLLALGLDQRAANAFLPFQIEMKQAEHISAFFRPPHNSSLPRGIGPADVHNRAPREIPLVAAGAAILGDGVLAQAQAAKVVFCQLPPFLVTQKDGAEGEPQNLRRTYRHTAFMLARLLGNMGVAAPTPLLARFSSPVTAASEKRWLDAFYLDQPVEWDDPYRFFRW